MRLSVTSLRRMIKGKLQDEFVRHELTSYSGLELVRRYLRQLGVGGGTGLDVPGRAGQGRHALAGGARVERAERRERLVGEVVALRRRGDRRRRSGTQRCGRRMGDHGPWPAVHVRELEYVT